MHRVIHRESMFARKKSRTRTYLGYSPRISHHTKSGNAINESVRFHLRHTSATLRAKNRVVNLKEPMLRDNRRYIRHAAEKPIC